MKQIIKGVTQGVFKLMPQSVREQTVRVVTQGMSEADIADAKQKIAFFLPTVNRIEWVPEATPSLLTSPAAILHGLGEQMPGWLRAHPGRFDINRHQCPLEGWNWIDAASYVVGHECDPGASRLRFIALVERLHAQSQEPRPCYVFGTGPSLAKAMDRDWSDGIRVVCNTIVRDEELWNHLAPHVIVAGDGIYHFGFTDFAKAFRRDLKLRLKAAPNTVFLYPMQFDVIVRREMPELADQLVPIPVGQHTAVHQSMAETFALPALGNILNLLLLPVGCNLSKVVGLWGFDGRAPDDKLFWSNSSKHSYTELLPLLQAAHPGFFDHNVPKNDPEKYIRSVHGDVLERCLSDAEAQGWTFKMLHHSWTPTLAKRHV
jgi:hypothetical protein